LDSGDYEPSALAFVREHVEQIMRTGTTDGVTMKDRPMVLMTYRSAKSGKVGKTPVMRVEHDGRYAAVASNDVQPTAWYPSLARRPIVELQDRTVIRRYHAREVFGDKKPSGGTEQSTNSRTTPNTSARSSAISRSSYWSRRSTTRADHPRPVPARFPRGVPAQPVSQLATRAFGVPLAFARPQVSGRRDRMRLMPLDQHQERT
jgi:deazaflavin-dependent oxidoreductase (nitroreductase family)